jgi:hypothetical protein
MAVHLVAIADFILSILHAQLQLSGFASWHCYRSDARGRRLHPNAHRCSPFPHHRFHASMWEPKLPGHRPPRLRLARPCGAPRRSDAARTRTTRVSSRFPCASYVQDPIYLKYSDATLTDR